MGAANGFVDAAHGRLPKFEDLISDDSMVRLKPSIHAWRNGRQPPIVTHDLLDDASDPVLKHLRHRNLLSSGLGGMILPFVGIKLIDLAVHDLLGA